MKYTIVRCMVRAIRNLCEVREYFDRRGIIHWNAMGIVQASGCVCIGASVVSNHTM